MKVSRLMHAARAVVKAGRHALFTDGHVLVSEKLQITRLTLCYACGDREDDRCGRCGCFLAPKTALATEACPAGYWQSQEGSRAP